MSIWKLIKGIRCKQLIVLVGFFLKRPMFMLSTGKATSQTLDIVQEKFPGIHGKDNSANAFRHALWNYLIAVRCLKNEKNIKTILSWTKEITDWHEDFSPNEPLARAMDLHNNQIGRALFESHENKTEKEAIIALELKLMDAVRVDSCEEVEKHPTNLVFIDTD
mgnify:CR=1 FL=1